MCGLAGLATPEAARRLGGREPRARLAAVLSTLAHRGPDAEGVWGERAASGAEIQLGHRRLSIIDLSEAGAQPMLSADGRYALSYNGEIYNYRALRAELEAAGALPPLRGGSDTEILLAAISAWGLAPALRRARGMFALALYDRREQRLRLARDAFGEKPLYYGVLGGEFVFASELKALQAHPGWRGDIDRAAIADCLAYGYIPTDRTGFEEVASLPPGGVLDLPLARAADPGAWALTPWFDAVAEAAEARAARFTGGIEAATDRLESLLEAAVARQLISDVPIGALLSGGIDSSTVCAAANAARRAAGASALKTFSLGFREAAFDESGYARAMAAHLGTDHHEITLSADDALALVEAMPALFDQPFTDPSQLPTYLVSRFARQHVTVALTGDGGDEMFAGYDRYRGFEQRCGGPLAPLKRLGRAASAWARLGAHRLLRGDGVREMRLWERALREPPALAGPATAFDRFTLAYAAAPRLCRADGAAGADPALGRIDAAARDWPTAARDVEAGALLDSLRYLPQDILVKVDRCAMAVSLEGRMPLLDLDIARFAWSLPDALRRADGRPKGLLRRLLARSAPPALFERPKRGFAIPLDAWLKGPFQSRVSSLLARDRLADEGLFEADRVDALWRGFLAGRPTPPHLIWMLYSICAHLEAQRAPQGSAAETGDQIGAARR